MRMAGYGFGCREPAGRFRPIADCRYMGQSKKMIATDLKTDLKKATLPVLLLAALGWYSATRAHIPAASTVDGVYSNPCCGKFVLRNGVVEIGSSRVPFYLASMKFGLTAYPT